MKQQKCRKCGKTLGAEVTWVTDDVLQVMWYCDDCKCGLVRDVYFTGTGAPSYFEDANMRVATIEGCPTDEEIQLTLDEAEAVRLEREEWGVTDIHRGATDEEEYVPLVEFVRGWKWQEGRGYGYFPKEGL